MHLLFFRDLLKALRLFLKMHFGTFCKATWVLIALTVVVDTAALFFKEESTEYMVVNLIALVVWLYLSLAFIRTANDLLEGNKPNLAVLPSLLFSFFIASVFSSFAVFGGLLLLVVPGIIFSVWYGFAIEAAALDGKTWTHSLRFSHSLVRGQFWQVTGRVAMATIFPLLLFFVLFAAVLTPYSLFIQKDFLSAPIVPLPPTPELIGLNVVLNLCAIFSFFVYAFFYLLLYRNLRELHVQKTSSPLPSTPGS